MRTLKQVESKANAMLKKYNKKFRFKWCHARSWAGYCQFDPPSRKGRKPTTGCIAVSALYVMHPETTDHDIFELLVHEIAHSLCYKENHGPVWRAKVIELGGTPKTYMDRQFTRHKYYFTCCQELCGETYGWHRYPRKLASCGYVVCKKCKTLQKFEVTDGEGRPIGGQQTDAQDLRSLALMKLLKRIKDAH